MTHHVHILTDGDTVNVMLPLPQQVPHGTEFLKVSNLANSTCRIQVRDDAGNPVGAPVMPGESKRVALDVDGRVATWGIY